MSVSKAKVRKLLLNAGVPIGDARVGYWRSSQWCFIVRQQTDTTTKYIVIESRFPVSAKEASTTERQKVVDALEKAGIKANIGYANVIFIDPEQREDYGQQIDMANEVQ